MEMNTKDDLYQKQTRKQHKMQYVLLEQYQNVELEDLQNIFNIIFTWITIPHHEPSTFKKLDIFKLIRTL